MKIIKKFILIFIFIFFFISCKSNLETKKTNIEKKEIVINQKLNFQEEEILFNQNINLIKEKDDSWFKKSIGYQIFVRSFFDSDNNGIGDINGIIEKLDYLNDGKDGGNDLEIDFIYLNPIFESASYHGYDTTNYFKINKDLGTMEDFDKLIIECSKRNIKVILDLTINHCSINHSNFIKAINGDKEKFEWFILKKEDSGWKNVFNNNENSFEKINSYYYYWTYSKDMVDFNLKNQQVIDYFINIAKFWLNKGIAGFRIGNIRYLIEEDENNQLNQIDNNLNINWLNNFINLLKKDYPYSVFIGEAYGSLDEYKKYINKKNSLLNSLFNCELRESLPISFYSGAWIYSKILNKTKSEINNSIDIIYTGNHDINRLCSVLENNENFIKSSLITILLTPSIPIIYYGDEIGLSNGEQNNDLKFRTPMVWNNEINGGFSKSNNLWNKLSTNWKERNVNSEMKDDNSILTLCKKIIKIRKEIPFFYEAEYIFHPSSNELLNYFLRIREDIYYIEINFSNKNVEGYLERGEWLNKLNLDKINSIVFKELYGSSVKTRYYIPVEELGSFCKIESFGYKIFKLIK